MKEARDTPRPTMSDEEMVKDYPRLAREYALLHQAYWKGLRGLKELAELQRKLFRNI